MEVLFPHTMGLDVNRILAGLLCGWLSAGANAQVLGLGVGVGAGAGGGVSIAVPLPQALRAALVRSNQSGALQPPAPGPGVAAQVPAGAAAPMPAPQGGAAAPPGVAVPAAAGQGEALTR